MFRNCYEDKLRAEAYSVLRFDDTYYLAFRDLPTIIRKHSKGERALDFGCGAGRSSRFLVSLGFSVVGVDISPEMIAKAKEIDPAGDYRLIRDGGIKQLSKRSFDLILSAFTFDNVAAAHKTELFPALAGLLSEDGRLINLVSSPEIYLHEWASFSTKDFPENSLARSGDPVRIITTTGEDSRPVEDILCTDDAYQHLYEHSGLAVEATYRPLADAQEPYAWVSETKIAPWVIYVLRRA